ncbi:MAG: hypothetical protein V1493_02565 [Candidatus Diapherotrites archaeon]
MDLRRKGRARKLRVGETYDIDHRDIFNLTGRKPAFNPLTDKQINDIKEQFPAFAKYAEKDPERGASLWGEFQKEEQRAARKEELLRHFNEFLRAVPWPWRRDWHPFEASDSATIKSMPELFAEHMKRMQGDARAYMEGQNQSLEYIKSLREEQTKRGRGALKFWKIFNLRHPLRFWGNALSLVTGFRAIRRAEKRHYRGERFRDPFFDLAAKTDRKITKLFHEFQEKLSGEDMSKEAIVAKLGPEFRDRFIAILDDYERERTGAIGWGILGTGYARNSLELSRRQGITPGTNLSVFLKNRKGLSRAARRATESSERVEARAKLQSGEEEGG